MRSAPLAYRYPRGLGIMSQTRTTSAKRVAQLERHIPDAIVITDWRKAFRNFAFLAKNGNTPQAKAYWTKRTVALFEGRHNV